MSECFGLMGRSSRYSKTVATASVSGAWDMHQSTQVCPICESASTTALAQQRKTSLPLRLYRYVFTATECLIW